MKKLLFWWTQFLPSYPKVLVYMLQAGEYKVSHYIEWLSRTADFRHVMRRQTLVMTRKAQLLVLTLRLMALVMLILVGLTIYAWAQHSWPFWWLIAVGLVIVAPYVLAYGIAIPLVVGRVLVQLPREKALVKRAKDSLSRHSAKRIAVLGSFGKTTAKEMLQTVLSQGFKVAATPGNMNTPLGIGRFVLRLKGDEEILIFEYGEEKPGDIQRLADMTQPEWAIITGINEAHLENFKTLERTEQTIFEITNFVAADHIYQNDESNATKGRVGTLFGRHGVNNWKVEDAKTSLFGTEFTMTRGDTTLHIQTKLVGLHTVGVSAAVAAMADEFGLSPAHIEAGFAAVVPFKHRMEAKQLHGAWVIDDTYNGNSDGVKAGLELLANVEAKRRIYVTPGLVEQGDKTAVVHQQIGRQAAIADVVVLMNNSVTRYITQGLEEAGYKGKLTIVDNPLDFYNNLDSFVAAGDVVLMQNDWTDNYA